MSTQYGKDWRKSMEEKYSIPKKEMEMENWKSSVERIKQEIHGKIQEIHGEIKKDTKILLNCFLEKEEFKKHMDGIFANLEKKCMRRKRRYDEIEQSLEIVH
jgi:uncharacterized coiled-coil DUF342 family protein